MKNPLITHLQDPALYAHPVKKFHLIETHSAWVLLTGEFAYKIKKPVDFEFLDYSSLEKRKHHCDEEVRLNQRLAPELYEGVIPITGSIEHPHLNGAGPIIEYAIKMREFPQDQLFSQLLAHQKLQANMIDATAKAIADFHQSAEHAAKDMYFGTAEQIREPVIQNFDQIRGFLSDDSDKAQLLRLENWEKQIYQKLDPIFQKRKQNGSIRACHGDLYLNNIILSNDKPLIFDCIEFNESFRWTDVMADVGFITMDLEENGRTDFANRLTSRYMEYSGDYEGLLVLSYYQSYRAVVRAKVTLFRLAQTDNTAEIWEKYRKGMALAEHYTQLRTPQLIITHGLSGSGKSTRAHQLVEQLGVIQIRSDVERKQLAGLASDTLSHSGVNENLYANDMTEKTYQRLLDLARLILQAGYGVVVDATFLKLAHRTLFKKLAKELKIPFYIVHCESSPEILQTRLLRRKSDPSEANLAVLAMQQDTLDPLTNEETALLM